MAAVPVSEACREAPRAAHGAAARTVLPPGLGPNREHPRRSRSPYDPPPLGTGEKVAETLPQHAPPSPSRAARAERTSSVVARAVARAPPAAADPTSHLITGSQEAGQPLLGYQYHHTGHPHLPDFPKEAVAEAPRQSPLAPVVQQQWYAGSPLCTPYGEAAPSYPWHGMPPLGWPHHHHVSVAPSAFGESIEVRLSKTYQLFKDGALTREEFKETKAQLLAENRAKINDAAAPTTKPKTEQNSEQDEMQASAQNSRCVHMQHDRSSDMAGGKDRGERRLTGIAANRSAPTKRNAARGAAKKMSTWAEWLPSVKVGDQLSAEEKGHWYDVTVIKIGDGERSDEVKCRWDDFVKQAPAWILRDETYLRERGHVDDYERQEDLEGEQHQSRVSDEELIREWQRVYDAGGTKADVLRNLGLYTTSCSRPGGHHYRRLNRLVADAVVLSEAGKEEQEDETEEYENGEDDSEDEDYDGTTADKARYAFPWRKRDVAQTTPKPVLARKCTTSAENTTRRVDSSSWQQFDSIRAAAIATIGKASSRTVISKNIAENGVFVHHGWEFKWWTGGQNRCGVEKHNKAKDRNGDRLAVQPAAKRSHRIVEDEEEEEQETEERTESIEKAEVHHLKNKSKPVLARRRAADEAGRKISTPWHQFDSIRAAAVATTGSSNSRTTISKGIADYGVCVYNGWEFKQANSSLEARVHQVHAMQGSPRSVAEQRNSNEKLEEPTPADDNQHQAKRFCTGAEKERGAKRARQEAIEDAHPLVEMCTEVTESSDSCWKNQPQPVLARKCSVDATKKDTWRQFDSIRSAAMATTGNANDRRSIGKKIAESGACVHHGWQFKRMHIKSSLDAKVEWNDMSSEKRNALATLGWNNQSWNDGDEIPFKRAWGDMTDDERCAALAVNFTAAHFAPQLDVRARAAPAPSFSTTTSALSKGPTTERTAMETASVVAAPVALITTGRTPLAPAL